MGVFENRWKTKESRKELADQFLKVAKSNEKEKAKMLVFWQSAVGGFFIAREEYFNHSDGTLIVCDWALTAHYEQKAKEALENKQKVAFRDWFIKDFSLHLLRNPISTNTDDPEKYYKHVNERYTQLLNIQKSWKKIIDSNVVAAFNDERDALLQRELNRLNFQILGMKFISKDLPSAFKPELLAHMFYPLTSISECSNYNEWLNLNKFPYLINQYRHESKILNELDEKIKTYIDAYYNLSGLLTYVEHLKRSKK